MDLIVQVWESGKTLAAMCAAPSLLAKLNILDGLKVACHPVVSENVRAANGKLHTELAVACDRNLITGKAAGASIDFGLKLVAVLLDHETSEQLRRSIYY